MNKAQVIAVTQAGPDHAVNSILSDSSMYRRSPCEQCPWRTENAGSFPAEAFVASAHTAYDAAEETFACHMSGSEKPAHTAGFLLRNSVHNIGVRLRLMRGTLDFSQVTDGGADLFGSYREMAIANGVDPEHPRLAQCRGDDE